MDGTENATRRQCPYDRAGKWSRMSFWWVTALVKTGWKRPLEVSDLYDVCDEDRSQLLLPKFERVWNNELQKHASGRNISLFSALLRTFWTEWVIPGLLIFLYEVMAMLQPFLIGQLMNYFLGDPAIPQWRAFVTGACLGLSSFIRLATNPNYFFILERTSIKMKIAVSGLIFRKALRLTAQAHAQTSSGKIINFLSTDVETFNLTLSTLHYLWIAPLQIIVGSLLILYFLGPSGFLYLIGVVLGFPVLLLSGKLFASLRVRIGQWSDKRISTLNEVIAGIRIVKMYCWERPFTGMINNLRRKEMRFVYQGLILKVINQSSVVITGKFMLVCVFVGSWMLGQPYSASSIYMCMGWLTVIQGSFCFWVFYAVENTSQMMASTQRIQNFLLLPEQGCDPKSREVTHHPADSTRSVEIKQLRSTWELPLKQMKPKVKQKHRRLAEEAHKLLDIGELIVVVGQVGSGKTSLLMTLLGEMPVRSGTVEVYGTMRYMTQSPWVFSGTVRDNVVFGDSFDRQRYQAVMEACALYKDVEVMPYGDLTRVGERGLMLSGGQKARVTLARTVYSEADLYLLDDPLSAVDTHVGRHLFHRCICGFLKEKTRLLVTHQLQYLKDADRIIVMNEGQIQDIGTYSELRDRGMDFSAIAAEKEEEPKAHYEGKEEQHAAKGATEEREGEEKEEQVTGRVGLAVYWRYLRAGHGLMLAPLTVLAALVAQSAACGGDWVLAQWAETLASANQTNVTVAVGSEGLTLRGWSSMPTGLQLYVLLFGAFASTHMLFSILYACMFALASQSLHKQMVHSVMRARTRFFDVNPVGRVLNRFSRDIAFMDNSIPRTGYAVFSSSVRLVGLLLTVCMVLPWLFIPILPLLAVVVFVRIFAVQTTRDLRRIEAAERSPVYAHVSDALNGLHTVRAFHKQEQFCQDFDRYLDNHTSAFFLFLSACRWFSLRSTFCTFIFFVIVILLCLSLSETVSGTLLGLALTYTTMMADPFEHIVRMTAELENYMTSVERVLAYTALDQEAAPSSDHPPPPDWPQHGALTFSDVTLQYTPQSPPALLHLSFQVHSREKVGIVGRTGAGKSSVLTALFRMTEPQGKIIIDGVNILDIGLNKLRQNISVIPQDPVLFSGSLRSNLDPFEEFQDGQVWHALEQVQLKEKVRGMEGELSAEMGEGGVNLSVGQRQLVCLARALLRQTCLLVLDEATANVDTATDELIQRTIRTKFKDCTVLTIAHRLHTVMDNDRIMVMEQGELKEFDTPLALMQIKDGFFSHLVLQTGPHQAKLLQSLAENAQREKKLAQPDTHIGKGLEEQNSLREKGPTRQDVEGERNSAELDDQAGYSTPDGMCAVNGRSGKAVDC